MEIQRFIILTLVQKYVFKSSSKAEYHLSDAEMPVSRSQMAEFPLLRAKWSEIHKLSLYGLNRHLVWTLITFAFLCYSSYFSIALMCN